MIILNKQNYKSIYFTLPVSHTLILHWFSLFWNNCISCIQSPSLTSTLIFTQVPHDTDNLLMTSTYISLVMTLPWASNSYIRCALTSFLVFIGISNGTFRHNVSKPLVSTLPGQSPASSCLLLSPSVAPLFTQLLIPKHENLWLSSSYYYNPSPCTLLSVVPS